MIYWRNQNGVLMMVDGYDMGYGIWRAMDAKRGGSVLGAGTAGAMIEYQTCPPLFTFDLTRNKVVTNRPGCGHTKGKFRVHSSRDGTSIISRGEAYTHQSRTSDLHIHTRADALIHSWTRAKEFSCTARTRSSLKPSRPCGDEKFVGGELAGSWRGWGMRAAYVCI